jgi:phosphoserine phosphatase RsbU/P
VLGLFEAGIWEQETLTLARDDFVVAFSDGVTEALNPGGEEFGDERLLEAIQAHRHEPPEQVVEGLLERVRAFSAGAVQNDDVTVVLVRFGE